jgi:hypothetical protein
MSQYDQLTIEERMEIAPVYLKALKKSGIYSILQVGSQTIPYAMRKFSFSSSSLHSSSPLLTLPYLTSPHIPLFIRFPFLSPLSLSIISPLLFQNSLLSLSPLVTTQSQFSHPTLQKVLAASKS